MARTLRDTSLDTRAARSRLAARGKPYYRAMEEGLHLGYRKPRGRKGKPAVAGKWVARCYVGEQSYRVQNIGIADDFSDADGVAVLSFSQAQVKAREQMVSRAHDAAGIAGPLCVNSVLDDYLAWFEDNRKSFKATKSAIDFSIRPLLGEMLVGDLTTDVIEKWHRDLAKRPAAFRANRRGERRYRTDDSEEGRRKRKCTANRALTFLKAALNRAWRAGKVASDDAWRRVESFQDVEVARVRWLEIPECNRLIRRAAAGFDKLVEGGLHSGCRYGELCRLNVEDFKRESGTLHVRKSKSGKGRHVELSEEGIEFFTRHCAGRAGADPMFLRHDGRRWKHAEQARPMKAACLAANINPSAGFNVLRHTWASLSVMNGMPLMVVAKNMGHTTTRMVEKHYGHLAPNYVREAVRKSAPKFKTKSNIRSLDTARKAKRINTKPRGPAEPVAVAEAS